MSKDDIQFLVKKIAAGAAIAKNFEADAVELHGYGGYLMDQFQSELWNKRTDEYGGSLENRIRFSVECIKAIREAVGPDFPILFKFTPYHGVPGGRELPEGIAMAKILEEAGVDALHIDMGCYEAWYKAINTVYQPKGEMIHLADTIRKNVHIPVLLNGKLNDLALANKCLEEEKADMVGFGHLAISDPHCINKFKRNESYDIVPCIGCNECLFAGFSGKILQCAVNPHAFAEDYYPVTPGNPDKRVLVIGGGPAGIMAAVTAAERGMQVELWEKENKLGGLLLAAGGPKFKKDVKEYVDYLVGKLYRSDVKVSLAKDGTPEEILAGNYDKVVFATGASPIIPNIPGIDKALVVGANDLLTNEKEYGKKVVVLGGGLVGCKTACHCADKADEVTVVELLPEILMKTKHSKNNDQALRQLMEDCRIKTLTDAKVVEIKDNAVVYETDGKQQTVEADTVAVAVGYKSNTALYDAVSSKVECAVVGDAEVPDNILKAVHHGFNSVRCI